MLAICSICAVVASGFMTTITVDRPPLDRSERARWIISPTASPDGDSKIADR